MYMYYNIIVCQHVQNIGNSVLSSVTIGRDDEVTMHYLANTCIIIY
jgi:hypothetical protein